MSKEHIDSIDVDESAGQFSYKAMIDKLAARTEAMENVLNATTMDLDETKSQLAIARAENEMLKKSLDAARPLMTSSPSTSSIPQPRNNYDTPPLSTRETNGAEETARSTECPCRHANTFKPVELPRFSGNPEEWPRFIEIFRQSTTAYGYTVLENNLRLQKCLTGVARETVEALLIHPSNIDRVIESLTFNFGRPELLIKVQLQKLQGISPIAEGKFERLIPLATKLENLTAFLKSSGSEQHLGNPLLLEEIVSKLPPSGQLDWAKFAYEIKPYATVEHLSQWLTKTAKYVALINKSIEPFHSKNKGNVFHVNETFEVRRCEMCKEAHELSNCSNFTDVSVSERWKLVKSKRLCFSCLKPSHSSTNCRAKRSCDIGGCRRLHHPLLHESVTSTKREQCERALTTTSQIDDSQTESTVLMSTNESKILYRIVPVKVYGPQREVETFALLDEGSSITIIDKFLADKIGAVGDEDILRLQWFGNQATEESSCRVQLAISGVCDDKRFQLKNVRTVKDLNLPVQSVDRKDLHYKYQHLKHLPIASYEKATPRILIGLDHCFLGLPRRTQSGYPTQPIACLTRLGWIVYGPTDTEPCIPRVCLIEERTPEENLYDIVEKYFSIEEFGSKVQTSNSQSPEVTRAREIMLKTTRRIGNRYETGLQWRTPSISLPKSYEMAFSRLVGVERKMVREANYATEYNNIISSYLEKGYARRLSAEELESRHPRILYLPHFLVTNKPGKFRLVFDAAAVANGTSLNLNLLKGPDENNNLVQILIKFREGEVAVVADIAEMFHQVRIINEDQQALRFLWRFGNVSKEPTVFVMRSMIFGSACSPASAQYIKNANAQKFADTKHRAVEGIVNRHYVDDYADSFISIEEAIRVSKDVRDIHRCAGFELKKFASNSREVLSELIDKSSEEVINMDKDAVLETNKILGMHWDTKNDLFVFKINTSKIDPRIMDGKESVTKRKLLRITMSIFDPYGFLSNFLIYPRRMLQEVWEIRTNWDDDVPENIQAKFNLWLSQFPRIMEMKIPRCYSTSLLHAEDRQLHIFVDASEEAYAAVGYLRIKTGNVDVAFVSGRAKVAPLKQKLTIPRMELQAAVLGTRLRSSILQSLSFSIARTVIWSDSQIVLHWIRQGSKIYKPFVAHRISEILESTSPADWRWVPSKQNAADATTRCVYPINFNPNNIWLEGPMFLKYCEEDWPQQLGTSKNCEEPQEEIRSQCILHASEISESESGVFEYLKKFSKWWRTRRVLAWVVRFVRNLKSQDKVKGELTVNEIRAAETEILKYVQLRAFGGEIASLQLGRDVEKNSRLFSLTPGLDNKGILRIFGRLDFAIAIQEYSRRPIVLPSKDYFVDLLTAEYHENFLHQNEHIIMNELRRKFHILRLRDAVQRAKRNCMKCRIRNAAAVNPIMGPLPEDRITPFVRPFTYTGLDYFGPIQITVARHREKRWVAIFTCLTTRATHLEIAIDLSSGSTLMCISNFVDRRGPPLRIRSDRGTNFVKAAKALAIFDNESVQAELARKNIEWLFNCPANPSSGGCWERLVQAVKRILSVTLREIAPKIEILHNLLCEAERMVNSRPLTEIALESTDANPLTPMDFLIGTQNADYSISFEVDLGKQFRTAQQLRARLWRKWISEYLPTLVKREKWRSRAPALKVDDFVIILDDNAANGKWLKGRIASVRVGKDGQIRSAVVTTSTGTLERPASKLAVINIESSECRGQFTGGGMSTELTPADTSANAAVLRTTI